MKRYWVRDSGMMEIPRAFALEEKEKSNGWKIVILATEVDAEHIKLSEEKYQEGIVAMRDAALIAVGAISISRISEKMGFGVFISEDEINIRQAADKLLSDENDIGAERAKDRKNYEDALTDMVKEKNEEIEKYRNEAGRLIAEHTVEIARLREKLEEFGKLYNDAQEEIERLTAGQEALAYLKEEIARLKKGEEQLSETATLLAVEIARLRKALGWYGNRDNYDWKFIDEWRVKTEKPVIVDGGKRAREALEGE